MSRQNRVWSNNCTWSSRLHDGWHPVVRNKPVLIALPCSLRTAHKVGLLTLFDGRQHANVSKLASFPHRTSTMLPLQLLRNVNGRLWCCGGGGAGGGGGCTGGGNVMLMPPFGGWLCDGDVSWWKCRKMLGIDSSPNSFACLRRYLWPCRWWKCMKETSIRTSMTHVSVTYGTHSKDIGMPVVVVIDTSLSMPLIMSTPRLVTDVASMSPLLVSITCDEEDVDMISACTGAVVACVRLSCPYIRVCHEAQACRDYTLINHKMLSFLGDVFMASTDTWPIALSLGVVHLLSIVNNKSSLMYNQC